MQVDASLHTFYFGGDPVAVFIPDRPAELANDHSPYWAKLWPAAFGLCRFLKNNLHYLHNKKVLELAAGLGLPGMVAAKHAAQVHLSDIEPQAVALMELSVKHNALTNVQCGVIDWHNMDNVAVTDILLLSDINYEPSSFPVLLTVIHRFLDTGCTVILSTPQRLMAKEFINELLPYVRQQDEIITETGIAVSVFVFRKI